MFPPIRERYTSPLIIIPSSLDARVVSPALEEILVVSKEVEVVSDIIIYLSYEVHFLGDAPSTNTLLRKMSKGSSHGPYYLLFRNKIHGSFYFNEPPNSLSCRMWVKIHVFPLLKRMSKWRSFKWDRKLSLGNLEKINTLNELSNKISLYEHARIERC